MSESRNQPSDIERRKKITFIRTDDHTSLFQDNFLFRPELTAERFASFYELPLRASHDPPGKILLDLYENDSARDTKTVDLVKEIHSQRQRARESEDRPKSGSESDTNTDLGQPSTVHVM
jgi:hypothetical protein